MWDRRTAIPSLRSCWRWLLPGQDMLDLRQLDARPSRMQDIADFTVGVAADAPVHDDDSTRVVSGAARVISTSSLLLWQVLLETYSRVGLDVVKPRLGRALTPVSVATNANTVEWAVPKTTIMSTTTTLRSS